jgi:hypothetical protein
MHCNAAKKAVWFASPLGIHVPENIDLKSWILTWLTCEDHFGSQVFCATLWKLWFERNQVVFKQKPFNPLEVARCAADFVADFNQSNPVSQRTGNMQQIQALNSSEVFDCIAQVDAGCFPDGYTTWGCVFKNQAGDISMATCKKENIVTDPCMAEALGVRWCLQLARNQGMQSVQIQTDALVVAECILGKRTNASLEPIIVDCIELLNSFNVAAVCYIGRQNNIEAHKLVGIAKHVGSKTWMGHVPDCYDALY